MIYGPAHTHHKISWNVLEMHRKSRGLLYGYLVGRMLLYEGKNNQQLRRHSFLGILDQCGVEVTRIVELA